MLANPKNNEKIIVGVVSLFMAFILGSYAQFVLQIGFSYLRVRARGNFCVFSQ